MPDLPKNVKLELLPPKEAVQYFQRRKLLTKTFSWQDLYQEEHTRQFTVAKLLRVDLLQTVYDAMQQAFTSGLSPKDFEKQLTPVLQQAGWWGKQDIADPATGEIVNAQLGSPERLRLIYDVNLRTGYAAGRWARIERGKRVNPFIIYRTARDDRVRASHRPWDNLALPVDDPFWNTHYPPNGWRCRCIAYGIDQAGLDRLQGAGFKIKTEAPKIEYREFTNRVTDKTVRVPVGIDPGWAYNPGKEAAQAENLAQVAAAKIESAPLALGAVAYTDLRGVIADGTRARYETLIERLYDHASTEPLKLGGERFIVGAIGAEELAAMQAQSLPLPDTAPIIATDRDLAHHARPAKAGRDQALPIEVLKNLPAILENKTAVLWDTQDPALIYVVDAPDGAGKLVIRTGYEDRVRNVSGKKQTVKENRLRTGGVVDLSTLKSSRYLLLTGEL